MSTWSELRRIWWEGRRIAADPRNQSEWEEDDFAGSNQACGQAFPDEPFVEEGTDSTEEAGS